MSEENKKAIIHDEALAKATWNLDDELLEMMTSANAGDFELIMPILESLFDGYGKEAFMCELWYLMLSSLSLFGSIDLHTVRMMRNTPKINYMANMNKKQKKIFKKLVVDLIKNRS